MESAQEQRKRKGGAGASADSSARSDVFDQLGNDGMKDQIADVRTSAEEEPSMLALVEGEAIQTDQIAESVEDQEVVTKVLEEEEPAVAVQEVAAEASVPTELIAEEVLPAAKIEEEQPELAPQLAEEKQVVVAVAVQEPAVEDLVAPAEVPESEVATAQEEEVEAEKAKLIVESTDPEKAPALAAMAGVDPVLTMDPKKLGNSDLAKEKALGAEGQKVLEEAMARSTAALGAAGALDTAATTMVAAQLRNELDVSDIVEARRENRLDELVQGALRRSALRSRDEVIFLLQQLAQDPRELGRLLAGGDLGVGLIEHLALNLGEVGDLYALAAYDHADIMKKVVLTDEARSVGRHLTPAALRMGGFASVLHQLVTDQFDRNRVPEDLLAGGTPEVAGLDPEKGPIARENVLALTSQLRQFRTAAA